MFYVYILYSKSQDIFYVGQTEDLKCRLAQHNSNFYKDSYTSQANDWELFYHIDCDSRKQAMKIEKHIKSMRKRLYYYNLKKYPEITQKLLEKFRGS
jgi:putative endonuclease